MTICAFHSFKEREGVLAMGPFNQQHVFAHSYFEIPAIKTKISTGKIREIFKLYMS